MLCQPTLDQTCTAKVNGQSVKVNPDGTFQIGNLPVSTQLVRVEVTCQKDGKTFFGRSEFFEVKQNQTFSVGDIALSLDLPADILFLTPKVLGSFLQTPGATSNVQVTAALANGMTVDVSTQTDGTTYTSSNTKVATVNQDGLVTAVGDGIAFLTAHNQGATGVGEVVVSFASPTEMVGFVALEDGTPLGDANLKVLGQNVTGTTNADGSFALTMVASTLGPLAVTAVTTLAGTTYSGVSLEQEPVKGGMTDAGLIVVRSPCDPDPAKSPQPENGELSLPSGMQQLSWNNVKQGSKKRWLVVGPQTLNLNVAANTVGATISGTLNFATAPLDGIDVLIFYGIIPNSATSIEKVKNFVEAGGGLFVGTVNSYSWVPSPGVVGAAVTSNNVGIVDPLDPILSGVSDASLDNWGNSSVREFLTSGGTKTLCVNNNSGRPVLLTDVVGKGRAVYTGMDMLFQTEGVDILTNALATLGEEFCSVTTYDVLLGGATPPTNFVCVGLAQTTCAVNLLPGTTYFWQVISRNGPESTPSAIWTFRTEK